MRLVSPTALALGLLTTLATIVACGGEDGTVSGPRCGDLVIEPGECEDGNLFNGDGCSSTCQTEPGYVCSTLAAAPCSTVCGDNIRAGTEACDDGNTNPGDGCDALCVVEAAAVEDCSNGADDDGDNAVDCDDSDCACTPPECGNGIVETGEACDDGDANGTADSDCTLECLTVGCGDGVVDGDEACDAGTLNNELGSCTPLCELGSLASCADTPLGAPPVVDLPETGSQTVALDSLSSWTANALWSSCEDAAFASYAVVALRNPGESNLTVQIVADGSSQVSTAAFPGCAPDRAEACKVDEQPPVVFVEAGGTKFVVVGRGASTSGSLRVEVVVRLEQGDACEPGSETSPCSDGLECRAARTGNRCLPPALAEGEGCLTTSAENPCVAGTTCRIIDVPEQGVCTADTERPADAACVNGANALPCTAGYRCTSNPLEGTTTCVEWIGAIDESCGPGGASRCGDGLTCVDGRCAGTPGASCESAPTLEELGAADVGPEGLGISVTPIAATGYGAAPCVSPFVPAYLARFTAPDRGLLRVEVASEVTVPAPANWSLGLMNGCGDFATPLACVTENVADPLLLEQILEGDQEVTLVFSGAPLVDAVVSFVPYLREGRPCDSTGVTNLCDTGLLCVSGTCQAAAEGACEAPYQLLSLADGDPEGRGALITVPAATTDTVLDSCGTAANDVTVLVQPPYAARVRVNWTGAPSGGAVSIAFGCAGSRTEVGCGNVAPATSSAALEVLIPADRNVLVSFSIPAGVTDTGFASFQYSRLGGEGTSCNSSIPCDDGLTCTRFSPFFPDGTCTRPG
jgi:cysteine-rich repeat protein